MKIFKRNGEVLPSGVPFELEQEIVVNVPEAVTIPADGDEPERVETRYHEERQTGRVAYPWNWLDLAGSGDLALLGVTVEEVADPVTVPSTISDRQFFQQLAIIGTITQAEALSAVKIGTIPAVLQAFVDAIPDAGAKFSANMLLAGATVFDRKHPLTQAIGEAQGMNSAQIDAFFIAAAAL